MSTFPEPISPLLVAVALPLSGARLSPACLDSGERLRATRLLHLDDRCSYIAAHTLKRLLLSALTGRKPAELEFVAEAHGKPRLAGNETIHFNLSHTSGMSVVACSRIGPVGVDVECRSLVPIEKDAAKLVLRDDELEIVEAAADRDLAFRRFWTAKEAVAKAEGKGLCMPMRDLSAVNDVIVTSTTAWQVWQYRPSDRHLLALAWEIVNGAGSNAPARLHLLDKATLEQWITSGHPPQQLHQPGSVPESMTPISEHKR